MTANQAEFPIAAMCTAFGVSRSSYYAWHDRRPSARARHGCVIQTRQPPANPGRFKRLSKLEAEKLMIEAELSAELALSQVHLYPNLPQIYRRKVEELEEALEHGPDRDEAREIVRSLIEQVVLTPREDAKGLDATLHGALAGILAACEEGKRKLPEAKASGSQNVGGCGGWQLALFADDGGNGSDHPMIAFEGPKPPRVDVAGGGGVNLDDKHRASADFGTDGPSKSIQSPVSGDPDQRQGNGRDLKEVELTMGSLLLAAATANVWSPARRRMSRLSEPSSSSP